MKQQPVYLRVLEFSAEKIATMLKLAINVMHADDRIRTEEWSLIKLVPDLLEVALEQAGKRQQEAWRIKLKSALSAVKQEKYIDVFPLEDLLPQFWEPADQQAVLLLLLKIIGAD